MWLILSLQSQTRPSSQHPWIEGRKCCPCLLPLFVPFSIFASIFTIQYLCHYFEHLVFLLVFCQYFCRPAKLEKWERLVKPRSIYWLALHHCSIFFATYYQSSRRYPLFPKIWKKLQVLSYWPFITDSKLLIFFCPKCQGNETVIGPSPISIINQCSWWLLEDFNCTFHFVSL